MRTNGGVGSFLDEHGMIPPGSTVLCAVSGGADSVCLLHILHSLYPSTLAAAHYNHRLRGEESDRDEAFVRGLCQDWGIPCYVGSGDVAAEAKARKQGIEETARDMRYAFLRQTARELGGAIIATAHNADDNAETILLNLIRGTGLRGLTGISPKREGLIRPLLNCTRQSIEEYLDYHHLPHVEDSSNRDETYTRNRLRAQVMPVLRELNPQAADHMTAAAAQLAAVDRYLDRSVHPYLSKAQTGQDRVVLPMKVLLEAPEALRPHIVLRLSEALPVGRKDLGALHLEAILSLKEGGRLDLPHGMAASCQDGLLELSLMPPMAPEMSLLPGRPRPWGSWTLTLLDHPEGPGLTFGPVGALTVGPCPPGARLTLPGSTGARTVKRLCLDQGIGLHERDALPAFYVNGQLAAVWPLGVDAAFVPEDENMRFIQIKHTEENET